MPPLNDDSSLDEDVRAAFAEVAAKTEGETLPEQKDVGSRQDRTESGGDGADRQQQDGSRSARQVVKDERGRFTSKPKTEETAAKPATKTEEADGNDESDAGDLDNADDPSKAAKPAGGPPPSWSIKAKAAWEQLPAEVRADIAKREGEVAQGFAALKDYKDLKPYADLAKQHGTTISAALKHYTGIENLLKKDLGTGLATILQNYGYTQQQAGQYFATLAQRFGGTAPQPQRGGQQHTPVAGHPNPASGAKPGDPLYDILRPIIDPLNQQVTELTKKLSSREEADRNASQQSLAQAIDTFQADPANRFFPDLEGTIVRLFETGMVPLTGNHQADLKAAYDMAARMNPDVQEALIEQRLREQTDAKRQREQDEANRAKAASRSLTGSRVPGTVMTQSPPPNGHDDVEADVRAAYRLAAQR
jgi:hypothetical protein